MPKITFNIFSPESIRAAAEAVKEYGEGIGEKAAEVRRRTAEELKEAAQTGFNGAVYDDVLHEGTRVPDTKVELLEEDGKSIVRAVGKEAVFQEFGAGVYYNGPAGSSPNPLNKGVFLIGTFGKGYGQRNVWGYYDEGGNLKLTHGTPASMPMYHAEQAVIPRIPEIAREVFRGK